MMQRSGADARSAASLIGFRATTLVPTPGSISANYKVSDWLDVISDSKLAGKLRTTVPSPLLC